MSHKISLLTSALLGILLTALVHDPTSEHNALWDREGEVKRGKERTQDRREGKYEVGRTEKKVRDEENTS